jgi:hypothetical protein
MLLVLSSGHFTSSRSRIATLAIQQRLPTMSPATAIEPAGQDLGAPLAPGN